MGQKLRNQLESGESKSARSTIEIFTYNDVVHTDLTIAWFWLASGFGPYTMPKPSSVLVGRCVIEGWLADPCGCTSQSQLA